MYLVHTVLKSVMLLCFSLNFEVHGTIWPPVIIFLFFLQLLCCYYSPPLLFLISLSDIHTHQYRADEKNSNGSEMRGNFYPVNASYREPGGSAVARLPREDGSGTCLTTSWPYSVSALAWCRLAPTWGAQAIPPHPLPSLLTSPICLPASPASCTKAQHNNGNRGRGT